MPKLYPHQEIEFESPRDIETWSRDLGVSAHELLTAINAVGPSLQDVQAYLATTREPMGAYVDRMRSRLDEIEVHVQQLSEERKNIVAFLEGFAQLQRSQRQGRNGLTFAISLGGVEPMPPDYGRGLEELTFRNINRHAGSSGSSSPVLDVVFQLLSDGKRRTVHEILSFLDIRGIPLKGANPPGFLSTLLSRDPRFDASRRDGWGVTT
jgi:hypothetical protein